MSPTDYLINAVLVLVVLRQLREKRLDLTSLLLPVGLVAVAAEHFLHAIPTAGNDVALIVTGIAAGAALGTGAAYATKLRLGGDGVALARATGVAAALWVAGMGFRIVFSYACTHGLGPSLAHFSAAHHITGGDAWTAALVLMAFAEVLSRLLVLQVRAWRLQRTPDIRLATA
jgi:hypothetical protein